MMETIANTYKGKMASLKGYSMLVGTTQLHNAVKSRLSNGLFFSTGVENSLLKLLLCFRYTGMLKYITL